MRWGVCENHRWQSVTQLDSSFRNAILEQNEIWLWRERVNCAVCRRGSDIVFETHNSRSVCLSSWPNKNTFNTSSRVELYEAEVGQDQQRMLIKEPLEVESRKHSTSCMRILKLTDAWKLSEIRVAYFAWGRIPRVSRKDHWENLGRRSQDENIKGQNRWEKASPTLVTADHFWVDPRRHPFFLEGRAPPACFSILLEQLFLNSDAFSGTLFLWDAERRQDAFCRMLLWLMFQASCSAFFFRNFFFLVFPHQWHLDAYNGNQAEKEITHYLSRCPCREGSRLDVI